MADIKLLRVKEKELEEKDPKNGKCIKQLLLTLIQPTFVTEISLKIFPNRMIKQKSILKRIVSNQNYDYSFENLIINSSN